MISKKQFLKIEINRKCNIHFIIIGYSLDYKSDNFIPVITIDFKYRKKKKTKKTMYNQNRILRRIDSNHIISHKLTDDLLKSLYFKSKL